MKIFFARCFLHGEKEQLLINKGIYDGHHQYSVYCKARGLKHANELSQDVSTKTFNPKFASICSNKKVVEFFETHPEVTYIIGDCLLSIDKGLITNLDIEALSK